MLDNLSPLDGLKGNLFWEMLHTCVTRIDPGPDPGEHLGGDLAVAASAQTTKPSRGILQEAGEDPEQVQEGDILRVLPRVEGVTGNLQLVSNSSRPRSA